MGMLLTAVFPEEMLHKLHRTKLAASRIERSEEEQRKAMTWSYHKSILFELGLFLWVLTYLLVIQRVLPNFKWDITNERCEALIVNTDTPFCASSPHEMLKSYFVDFNCFPYGNATQRNTTAWAAVDRQ